MLVMNSKINFPIHEIFCVSPLPYYLDWFEKSYPNVPLNRYDSPFFLQCMNEIQGTKPLGRQWNIILNAVVIILKYNKSTIDHAIYIIKNFDVYSMINCALLVLKNFYHCVKESIPLSSGWLCCLNSIHTLNTKWTIISI